MSIEHQSEIPPHEQIAFITRQYQTSEFLPQEYPNYGIDRYLLENYEVFDSFSSGQLDLSREMKREIQELMELRTIDLRATGAYTRPHESAMINQRIPRLKRVWENEYLLPRTTPATPDDELNFWMSAVISRDDKLVEGKDYTVNQHLASEARIVLYDTHLVPGLWGAAGRQFIVPPNVTLTGEHGHCRILNYSDLGPSQDDDSSLAPSMSPEVAQALEAHGHVVSLAQKSLDTYRS